MEASGRIVQMHNTDNSTEYVFHTGGKVCVGKMRIKQGNEDEIGKYVNNLKPHELIKSMIMSCRL